MRKIILIAHNLRSAHNVGSLLRTADGLGLEKIYLTGYTPYPEIDGDKRLPHMTKKIHSKISKTALGAEKAVNIERYEDIFGVIKELSQKGYLICALEQSEKSIKLPEFNAPQKVVLIVGREVEGLEPGILRVANAIVEIPMSGQKESFNVTVAAAIALYQLSYGL